MATVFVIILVLSGGVGRKLDDLDIINYSEQADQYYGHRI